MAALDALYGYVPPLPLSVMEPICIPASQLRDIRGMISLCIIMIRDGNQTVNITNGNGLIPLETYPAQHCLGNDSN